MSMKIPTTWGDYFRHLVKTYVNKDVIIDEFLDYIDMKESELYNQFHEVKEDKM